MHSLETGTARVLPETGAVRLTTTVLLTAQEVDAATKKTVKYTPPGK